MTSVSGSLKRGQQVKYDYLVGAISCCQNGRRVKGKGRLVRRERRGGKWWVVRTGPFVYTRLHENEMRRTR